MKRSKLEWVLSLKNKRSTQFLIGLGFLYLLMVGLEVPFVVKVVNQEDESGNLFFTKPYALDSEEELQDKKAPIRPFNDPQIAAKIPIRPLLMTDAIDEIFQLIKAHQEKAVRLPPLEEVKTFLVHSRRGMLSTVSQKHEGYPSGSMVDFACDANGSPILALSDLAIHTKDLVANPKCSLLVAKDPDDRTDLIITLHGDAVCVPESEKDSVRTSYLAKHPDAFWIDFDDFQFFRVEPKAVRFVSGVATDLLRSGEFTNKEYIEAKVDQIYQFSKPIASHMNEDHTNETKLIVQHSTSVPVESAYMLDVDSLGFSVKAAYQTNNFKLRIPFPRRAEERKDVKTLIIEMLQAAKSRVN